MICPDSPVEKNKISSILNEEMKYENPEYKKARNKNNIEEYIFNYTEEKEMFVIPKGATNILKKITRAGIPMKFKADKTKGREIEFKHKYEPRDREQVNAIDSYLKVKSKHALLIGSCGFGKTFCALKLIEKIGINTVIIVDETLILEQWYEALEDDCIIDMDKVGVIGNGKEDYKGKDIVIASKDTLINRPEVLADLSNEFGMAIVDEAHVCSADVFQRVLKGLKPLYLLGLTATPDRSDGASYLMYDEIGQVCFKADFEYLIAQGSVMKPHLKTIFVKRSVPFEELYKEWNIKEVEKMKKNSPRENGKYKWKSKEYTDRGWKGRITKQTKSDMDWHFLTTQAIEKDTKTIKEVAKLIKFHYDNGDQMICICQKVEFSKRYIKALEELGVPSEKIGLLLGNTKSKERKRIIAEAKKGDIKIVLSSTILDKAISINPSNVLFSLYPSKNNSTLTQRLGRISRVCDGKKYAVAYDVVYDHGIFFSQFYSPKKECRMNVYPMVSKPHAQIERDIIPYLIKYYWYKSYDKNYFDEHTLNFDKDLNKQLNKKFVIQVD